MELGGREWWTGKYLEGSCRIVLAVLSKNFLQDTAPRSINSALDGGEWSASRSGRFTPGKNPQVAVIYVECWVGPRASLNAVAEKKSLPLPGIEPRLSSVHPLTVPTELSWVNCWLCWWSVMVEWRVNFLFFTICRKWTLVVFVCPYG
jgi:hypothetical protein